MNITVGIVIQEPPMCQNLMSSVTMINIGSGTTYVNADSETLIICCPVEGNRLSTVWKKNGIPIINGSGYDIQDNYLRVESLLFEDSCVTYTCEVAIEGLSTTTQENSIVCTGGNVPQQTVIMMHVYHLQTELFHCFNDNQISLNISCYYHP